MKYFRTVDKNVPAIFKLQWKIENISECFCNILCYVGWFRILNNENDAMLSMQIQLHEVTTTANNPGLSYSDKVNGTVLAGSSELAQICRVGGWIVHSSRIFSRAPSSPNHFRSTPSPWVLINSYIHFRSSLDHRESNENHRHFHRNTTT